MLELCPFSHAFHALCGLGLSPLTASHCLELSKYRVRSPHCKQSTSEYNYLVSFVENLDKVFPGSGIFVLNFEGFQDFEDISTN